MRFLVVWGTPSGRPRRALATFGLAIVLAGLSTGCASMKPTQSGFLGDYSRLEPTGAFLNWGIGRHRSLVSGPCPQDLEGVDSFYIEPVVWLAPETDWLGHNEDRRDRVGQALQKALCERFGKIRPVVATPGPGTARVRAAVTDVASARVFLNIVASIVWGPVSNGGAVVEAEVIRPDGRSFAAIVAASEGGMLDIVGFYTRSGHGKKAVRRVAGELAGRVEGVERR